VQEEGQEALGLLCQEEVQEEGEAVALGSAGRISPMREKLGTRRLCVLAIALFIAALFPAGAGAATITVAVTNDAANGSFDDTGCTLRDAIQSANTNASIANGCNGDNGGGTGNDTILLQGGQTYKLTQHATPEDDNATGDLDVTGGGITTIRSVGSGLATIDADSNQFPGPANDTRGRALDVSSGSGGLTLQGIRVTGGTVTDGSGGGGIKTGAPLTLINSEVSGNATGIANTPSVTGGFGGGINVFDPGALTMTGSTVADNRVTANSSFPPSLDSARGGGIIYASFSHPFNATNSTISGNVVDSQGNTTNTSYAGGIYWQGFTQSMNLTNVTVSNNKAIGGATAVTAGGIVIWELPGPASGTTIKNSIIAGNTAPVHADCEKVHADDDFISAGNNVFGNFSGCTHTGGTNDASSANPLLGPLANFGGLTRTQILNPGSPAIDRGGTCPQKDQRGFFRAAAPPCDAGALELNATATPPQTPVTPVTPVTPMTPATPNVAPIPTKKCKKKGKKAAAAKKKCKKKAKRLAE
jgi:CSLREA domain-containing protein